MSIGTHELRRSDGLMYLRYRRSIRAVPAAESTPPGVDIRTCAHCGRRTRFHLDDAAGQWYACTACGHLA
jgi:hypothetical protein